MVACRCLAIWASSVAPSWNSKVGVGESIAVQDEASYYAANLRHCTIKFSFKSARSMRKALCSLSGRALNGRLSFFAQPDWPSSHAYSQTGQWLQVAFVFSILPLDKSRNILRWTSHLKCIKSPPLHGCDSASRPVGVYGTYRTQLQPWLQHQHMS